MAGKGGYAYRANMNYLKLFGKMLFGALCGLSLAILLCGLFVVSDGFAVRMGAVMLGFLSGKRVFDFLFYERS